MATRTFNDLAYMIIGFFGLSLGQVYGADVSLIGTMDTTSSGKVSTAKMLKKGHLKTGLFVDSSAFAVPLKDFSPKDSDLAISNDKLLKAANRTSLFVGYGLYDWMELNLGIRSTTDDINSAERKEFFQRFDQGGYYERDTSGAEAGLSYAGSILSAKFLALDLGNLKLAVSGFMEEGIGDEGKYSASKSEGYKFGYYGLFTYGYKDLGQVNLNLGYRSRKAEEVGGNHIGNEFFSKSSLMYHMTKRWGIYSTIDARAIKVAKTTEYDSSGYLKYKYKSELASQLGVTGYFFKNYKLDVYAGGGLSSQTSVGNSERYFGLSMTVPLYAPKGQSMRPRYLITGSKKDGENFKEVKTKNQVKDEEKSKSKVKATQEAGLPKKDKKSGSSATEEKSIYDLPDMNTDFDQVKRNHLKNNQKKSVDIDSELKKYQDQDRKRDSLEEVPYYTSEETKDQYEQYVNEKKRAEEEIARKLERELGSYEITEEDVNWRGLE